MTELDPRTPVVVGVGQFAERISDPGYRRLSAVDVAAEAVRAALADTGARAEAVAAAIDTVAGIRQFEISTPFAPAPLGRSDNYPRSVAARIGAEPRRAILEVVGGQGPQHLVTELAGTIAAGNAEVALAFGSEVMSTIGHLAAADDKPDYTEHADGDLQDRGYGIAGLVTRELAAHRVTDPPTQYALFENARRARLGCSREDYAASMGELFAPFTKMAANNPLAAVPVERTAAELVTPTEKNRPIADPYTRDIVAREKVNQGAAVLVMSIAAARELGVPQEKWVFLHGHADLVERTLMERTDLGAAPAAVLAVRHALELAGIDTATLSTMDLYSCFPIAVFAICDGLGLTPEDPRGLTLTGGLPYFGGPGNNYSMHAIAETVHRMRAEPGAYGLVGANGGLLSKYSAGVYSTTPAPWRPSDEARLQREIDSWPAVPQERHPDGWASIETYTVQHRRNGKRTGIVIGRLEGDGRRFVAISEDEPMLDRLSTGEPVGTRVYVRSFGYGNRVTVGEERMNELFPPRPKVLRENYEHVLVRRDGHLLEITINRPGVRNSLHPAANEELDEIFDVYFADPDLWVAILTGAGEKAFSSGEDLEYLTSGKPVWTPKNGFAGLTNRRELPKPVIAAVNGDAFGAGMEIALACHLVIADSAARFGLPQAKSGRVADAGGLVRLPRRLPEAVAADLILTGRELDAEEAHQYGLLSRVTPAGKALEGAREAAAEILEASPTAVRLSLRMMAESQDIPGTADAVNHQSPALDELMVSADTVEGMAALAQRRRPVWRNR